MNDMIMKGKPLSHNILLAGQENAAAKIKRSGQDSANGIRCSMKAHPIFFGNKES
jgi:hypothetical protein